MGVGGQGLEQLGLGLGQALGLAVAGQFQPLHIEHRFAQSDFARRDRLDARATQDGVDGLRWRRAAG